MTAPVTTKDEKGASKRRVWRCLDLNSPMIDDTQIAELLKRSRRIAVVGLSDKPWRPSFGVTRYMASRGYEIIPVNPKVSKSLGKTSYASLDDVPGSIDIVNIFRRACFAGPIVDQAAALGVKCIWMQEGVRDEYAAERARGAGIPVIQDRCILKYHRRLVG